MTEFAAALLGALVGAIAGAYASYRASVVLTRDADKQTVTDRMVDEFFSDGFLRHRIAIDELSTKVRSHQVDVYSVASGFLSPAEPNYYRGPDPRPGELNEHQHLEAYIGYIVRLARALTHGRLDHRSARTALGMHLQWHDRLLQDVANAAEELARKGGLLIPNWTESAREVGRHLVIPAATPRCSE
ncbi:hypothetical protein V7793_18205 [Streptomyces sp. KLMMK]|uniref:hypothetical protein n=1 Tax=Streptomyces sp. KLMMK TaxID=3109353 RepID=UPI00300BBE45